jgi:hypothetical protein
MQRLKKTKQSKLNFLCELLDDAFSRENIWRQMVG